MKTHNLRMKITAASLFFFCCVTFAGKPAWSSDVPGVDVMKLSPKHWAQKLNNAHVPLLSQSEISHYNQALVESSQHLAHPLSISDTLSKQSLLTMTQSIRKIPSSPRFYADGQRLTEKDYASYLSNVNVAQISNKNTVRYGLVVKRASLRKFPTDDRVFNVEMDTDLDRFQESGIFPGAAVAILLTSKDKKWFLVQAYNYVAWISADKVAIGEKQHIADYVNANEFLLVTGSKIYTNYVPELAAISQLQLDMGVRLPIVPETDIPNQLYGQNPYSSHVVYLPTRDESGALHIVKAMIARSNDVHLGYLPFTPANLITQAFKFLGERYGWGHDYNGRDCTGFVSEIYQSFGILMPRNSGAQGKSESGINFRFNETASKNEKLQTLSTLHVGDLIYIPGHVLMYLGEEKGIPYVIHDVKGLAYFDTKGEFYRGTLNGVAVTPLLPLHVSESKSYLESIYNIKRIR